MNELAQASSHCHYNSTSWFEDWLLPQHQGENNNRCKRGLTLSTLSASSGGNAFWSEGIFFFYAVVVTGKGNEIAITTGKSSIFQKLLKVPLNNLKTITGVCGLHELQKAGCSVSCTYWNGSQFWNGLQGMQDECLRGWSEVCPGEW